MRAWLSVTTSTVLLAATGCGGANPQQANSDPPTRPAASSVSPGKAPANLGPQASLGDLSKLSFTPEVTTYQGPSLSREEYKKRVNTECRAIKMYVEENPKPSESDGEAVIVAWAAGLLKDGSSAYQTIAAMRPPVELEAEVRTGFLGPYYDQLNAAERLYIEVIGGDYTQEAVRAVLADAQEAKKNLTIYAAKNDLTDCIG